MAGEEKTSTNTWFTSGQEAIERRLAQRANVKSARNIILFIGDGMGVSTVTAARILDGQSKGTQGEKNILSFETFPNVALVKTYNTNQQVSDSAGTASTMNTGIKTRIHGTWHFWKGPSGQLRGSTDIQGANTW